MKLTDLRDELNARAETTDDTPDLLSGVHAKITRTKRRRKTGALGAVAGVAVIAAFATGVLPGLTTTAPQPAEDVPHDYVKNGITIPALSGADRLEKAWVGDVGQNTLDFSWTPKIQDTRFAPFCPSGGNGTRFMTIVVNEYVVGTIACITDPQEDGPGNGISLQTTNTLWLAVPAGKPAHVVAKLTDENGTPVRDDGAQTALGIYRTAEAPPEGPPAQVPPISDDDYFKEGVRYRAKIGGDTLLGARVADRGTNAFEFEFTGTGRQLSFRPLCTATNPGPDPQYWLALSLDGKPATKTSCMGDSLDAGQGGGYSIDQTPPAAGQKIKVSVRLEDNSGKPVSRPQDWIGMAVYGKGMQRAVDSTMLDEVTEYNGHNYRLAKLETVAAATADHLELATPADTPFLVSYGSTGDSSAEGTTDVIHLTGLGEETGNQAGGYGTYGVAARPAGAAKITLKDMNERPVAHPKGKLFMAIYLPAD